MNNTIIATTATTNEESEEIEEKGIERQYYYEQIKNYWPAYRKAAKPIEVNINKVISSYHEEHPDWSARNIVKH